MATDSQTLKRLLTQANDQYLKAQELGGYHQVSYWHGYMRAVRDALKGDHQASDPTP